LFLGPWKGLLALLARETPHLVQATWFGSVSTPQLEQNFFSAFGGTPQLGQATAWGWTSLPQFRQNIVTSLTWVPWFVHSAQWLESEGGDSRMQIALFIGAGITSG